MSIVELKITDQLDLILAVLEQLRTLIGERVSTAGIKELTDDMFESYGQTVQMREVLQTLRSDGVSRAMTESLEHLDLRGIVMANHRLLMEIQQQLREMADA